MTDALAGRSGLSKGRARRQVLTAHTITEHPLIGGALGRATSPPIKPWRVGMAHLPEQVRKELVAAAAAGQTAEQTAEAVAAAERTHTSADAAFERFEYAAGSTVSTGRPSGGPGPAVTVDVVVPHTWLAERSDTAGITINGAAHATVAASTVVRGADGRWTLRPP